MANNIQPPATGKWLPCPIWRGISMANPAGKPSRQDGDTVFVNPDRQAVHRSRVIARLDDEKKLAFRPLPIKGVQRMLQTLNPNWPKRIIPINGNRSIGGVVMGKVESFI